MSQSRKKSEVLLTRGARVWNSVVRGSGQVSMHEMRKRKQIHEDARQMYRTKSLVKKFEEMGKAPSGRT